jgi:ADP-ribose pyrophosphatase YjhB (NUDIX family)
MVRRDAVVDLLYRVTYRCAYRMMRVYWAVMRPTTHGALVALWHDGKILLVRNSYVRYYSLPGGYVHGGESGRDAAVRELYEEARVRARPDELRSVVDKHHDWEGKREHIEVFELDVPAPPSLTIDNREVVEASFFTPERALALDLFPPLREAIQHRLGRVS